MFKLSPTKVRSALDKTTFTGPHRLQVMEQTCGWVNFSINDRAEIQARIDAHRLPDGQMDVLLWSRDCDGTECTYSYKIKATLHAYYTEYQRVADGAEGPYSLLVGRRS